MRKETSILYKLPIKMFIYTVIISFFVYMSIYKFFQSNFEREIRETAVVFSTATEWALIPLIREGDGHKKDIEDLFDKITINSMVTNLRIYDKDSKIIYSSDRSEIGLGIRRELIKPIIEDGALVEKNEDYKNFIYETALPLRKEMSIASSTRSEKYVLYLKMDFSSERITHYRFMLLFFTIVVFFMVILLAINNSLIKYYILTPVLQMKKGLQKIAKGEYDHSIPMKKGKEVNDLIRVFNQMIQNIRESNEILRKNKLEAERLNEAKGAFLANMTHELRTPLNSIIGYSELLLEDEEDEEKQGKVRAVVDSGKHLLSIINNVLDFSKMDVEKLKLIDKVFDVRGTFETIEKLFKIHSLQKNIEFKMNIEDPFPNHLKGDEGRLKQILINLISNAFKFTKEGKITVDARYRRDRLFVKVSDTGQGIREDALPNIFNSFEQVDVHHKGTGLGLTITKTLCKLMKGDITVESVEGEGTKFSFNVEMPKGTPKKVDDLYKLEALDELFLSEEEENPISSEKFKILVAEDIRDNQLVLKMMLKKLEVDIDFADNGQIALDLLRKNKYDLFLLDIQMPVLSGLEVLAELTKTGEIDDIYVVALTAYSMNTEKGKILNAGAKGILTKPLSKDQLRGVVSFRMKQKRS